MTKIMKLDFLLAFYVTALVCSELLGSKIFTFLGINASVAIFVYPLTFTIEDMITEVYGRDRARSFIKSGFFILLFLFLFTTLATVLPPAGRFQKDNGDYVNVFARSQRIIIASLISFWLGEQFDLYIFSKIRQKLGKKRLWFRVNVSNFFGELVDTTLFMFLAFFTPGSTAFIISLIIPYWILKSVMSVFETPITYMGVSWLQKEDNS